MHKGNYILEYPSGQKQGEGRNSTYSWHDTHWASEQSDATGDIQ